MSESNFWRYIHKKMAGHWTADRIENMVGAGIPDVTYCCKGTDGWLELKYMKNWPKRESTLIKVGLEDSQYAWMRRRLRNRSKNIFVFVQVGKEYTLIPIIDIKTLELIYRGFTEDQWEDIKYYWWNNSLNIKEFMEAIT